MANTPVDPVIEMKIGGVWTDITADVRLDSADSGGNITIERGVPNEGGSAEPTQFDLVLNNAEGKYSPKNPYSVNFGQLGHNTPVRMALSRRTDDFNRTEVDTWGRMPTRTTPELESVLGDRYSTIGGGNRLDITPNAATIAAGTGYTIAQFGEYGDVEVRTRFKVSNLTSEVGIVLRSKNIEQGIDSGDFEDGIGTWTASGGTSTLAVQTATFHTGTRAALLTVAGSPTTATAKPGAVAVIPGETYRSRWWLRCTLSMNATITTTWYDASMVLVSTSSTTSAMTANTWGTHEFDAAAPDAAAFAVYSVGLAGSPANGTLLYIDDVDWMQTTHLDFLTAYLTPGTPDLLRLGIVSPDGVSANWVSQASNIATNTWYWMAAQITGNRRRVKLWADGSDEPLTWGFTYYNNQAATNAASVLPSGQVGLFAKDGSATVTFSSLEVNIWRAHAEITELPPRYDLSRQDRWVPISARGVLRRLGQGRKALESPVTRHLNQYASLSRFWFPLEVIDESATSVGNRIPGAPTGTAFGLEQGTIDETGTAAAPGLAGCAILSQDGSFINANTLSGAASGPWTWLVFFRIPSTTAGDALLFQLECTGTARKIQVIYGNPANVTINVYDGDGGLLSTDGSNLYFNPDHPQGCWIAATIYLVASGGNTLWAFNFHKPGGDGFFTNNGSYSGVPGTLVKAKVMSSTNAVTAGGLHVSSMFHYQGDLPFVTDAFARAAYAYIGEEAQTRFLRLASDAGVLASSQYSLVSSRAMGPQRPSKLLDLWDECAIVDDGIIVEERETFAITMIPRNSLYCQDAVVLNIDEGHLSPPLDPTADDQRIRNDVTVSRPGGGFYRSVAEDGPLNTNTPEDDPENGVGTYEESIEQNHETDADLQPAANWRRSKGTLDVARYPSLTADLASSAYQEDGSISAQVASLDAGSIVSVFNSEVDYAPSEQIVQGYVERIGMYEHNISFVTSPGTIWRPGVLEQTTRVATRYIHLDADFDAGTDVRLVTERTAPGALWVQVADSPESFPFEIEIEGCRLMVEATGDVLGANPYFDEGISGWSQNGGTTLYWDRYPDQFKTGVGSLRTTAVGGLTGGAIMSSPVVTTPAADYQISGWLMTNVDRTDVRLVVDWYQSDGVTFISTSSPAAIATTAYVWRHYTATVTAPALGARAFLRMRAVLLNTNIFWGDELRIMKSTSFSGSDVQTLSVKQAPTNGVEKTLNAGAAVTVVDPWRLAF